MTGRRITRRDFLCMSAAGTLGLGAGGSMTALLQACGASATPSRSPVRGGHLVEGTIGDPLGFNPVLLVDPVSTLPSNLMFDGLLDWTADGSLAPAIARSLPEISTDHLTYTFRLREGVRWSDGRPLTAEDVVFTYRLVYDPFYREVRSPLRGNVEEYLESVTAPDQQTVVFRTKRIYAPFLATVGRLGIVPKHVLGQLAPAEITTAPFNTGPLVVNGAFRFARWDKGQQVTFTRNDSCYRGKSLLDAYVYKVVGSSTGLVDQLKTGEIDVATVDPSAVADLEKTKNVSVVAFDVPNVEVIAFQLDPAKHGGAIFSDKAVRQALLYGLDRQAIVKAIYFNQAKVADAVEPPVSWAHSDSVRPIYRHDKKKAASMLDAAGWRIGSSGIREKNGRRLSFEMVTTAELAYRRALVQTMEAQWKEIGVEATPRPIAGSQLVAEFAQLRSFEMWVGGFQFNNPDPDQSGLWHSRNTAPGGLNAMGYRNSQLDALLDAAVATLDQKARKEKYDRIQNVLADDVPAVVVFYNRGIWGVNNRVQGMKLGPYNRFGPRPWMKDVFVADGK